LQPIGYGWTQHLVFQKNESVHGPPVSLVSHVVDGNLPKIVESGYGARVHVMAFQPAPE